MDREDFLLSCLPAGFPVNVFTPISTVSCSHGTRCAGEVAAARDNGICGVGVAYDSKIAGKWLWQDPLHKYTPRLRGPDLESFSADKSHYAYAA